MAGGANHPGAARPLASNDGVFEFSAESTANDGVFESQRNLLPGSEYASSGLRWQPDPDVREGRANGRPRAWTSAGRKIVVDALTQVRRNIRRGNPWYADADLIDTPDPEGAV